MPARYRQMLAEVRRSYTPEKAADEARNEFLAFILYRPLSFLVTPLFLRLGFTADAVTVAGGLATVAMLPVAFLGGPHAFWVVIALGLAVQVLDCVDGNVARVTGRRSPVGGMLDGMGTQLFWTAYFASVGALAEATATGWIATHGREIGLALAALMFAQRSWENTFEENSRQRVRWEPPVPAAGPRFDLKRWAKVVEQVVAFGGLTAAGLTARIDWFLALLAGYQLTVLALWLPRFAAAVHRRSQERLP